jgi:hypothetical protein
MGVVYGRIKQGNAWMIEESRVIRPAYLFPENTSPGPL